MSRRVWRGLLEKEIQFEPIVMNLNGDQLEENYLKINPFHHIPAIVNDGLRVIESIAILEYLETKYPIPSLLPKEVTALAKVRMVQMVSTNELLSKIITFIFAEESQKTQAQEHIDIVLKFFTEMLEDNPYFGGESVSLGDIVAGTDISLLEKSGFPLTIYPKIHDWYERLMQREAWQKSDISQEELEKFKRVFLILQKRKMRNL
jgi:glutathione S-transferase